MRQQMGFEQTQRFPAALSVIHEAISDHVFPGISVAVAHEGEHVLVGGVGQHSYHVPSPKVMADTVYDLASLTKVIGTTAMAMLLHEHGKLELDAPVSRTLPAFPHQAVTMRMLLAHCSGLPGYLPLYKEAKSREQLLEMAIKTPLQASPGTHAEYSDIGFIIMGHLLETIAGERLDVFLKREVLAPLGMSNTTFNPPEAWLPRIPPTEDDFQFRRRVVRGEVHDENAFVLGGVAGHAGLFGTAADVLAFAECILRAGEPLFKRETVELFCTRQASPAATSRALGWDTPSSPSQSGRYFGPRSVGHLGFTGTSLWLDFDRQLAIVLLTNRTWPRREYTTDKIKAVRPVLHDAIIEALS